MPTASRRSVGNEASTKAGRISINTRAVRSSQRRISSVTYFQRGKDEVSDGFRQYEPAGAFALIGIAGSCVPTDVGVPADSDTPVASLGVGSER